MVAHQWRVSVFEPPEMVAQFGPFRSLSDDQSAAYAGGYTKWLQSCSIWAPERGTKQKTSVAIIGCGASPAETAVCREPVVPTTLAQTLHATHDLEPHDVSQAKNSDSPAMQSERTYFGVGLEAITPKH